MGRQSQQAGAVHDPTVYPEQERVGEEILQRWIAELLRPLLERWLNEQGVFFVGADQFIYYRQHDPHRRYAPDVYVLPGVPPATRVRIWKTWETRISPSFALEVVSRDWEKDYVDAPARCGEAGVGELVVFDPAWADRPGGAGVRLQLFRATRKRGFRRTEATNDDRVHSRALGCFLRVVGAGDAVRLRIGVGPDGNELVPTAEEAALARIAALEAELARLTKKSDR